MAKPPASRAPQWMTAMGTLFTTTRFRDPLRLTLLATASTSALADVHVEGQDVTATFADGYLARRQPLWSAPMASAPPHERCSIPLRTSAYAGLHRLPRASNQNRCSRRPARAGVANDSPTSVPPGCRCCATWSRDQGGERETGFRRRVKLGVVRQHTQAQPSGDCSPGTPEGDSSISFPRAS